MSKQPDKVAVQDSERTQGPGLSENIFAKDYGPNRTYFGGIERGERNLTFAVLCKICNGLHCDIADVTRGIPRASYPRNLTDG
jgi:hypothetical protein